MRSRGIRFDLAHDVDGLLEGFGPVGSAQADRAAGFLLSDEAAGEADIGHDNAGRQVGNLVRHAPGKAVAPVALDGEGDFLAGLEDDFLRLRRDDKVGRGHERNQAQRPIGIGDADQFPPRKARPPHDLEGRARLRVFGRVRSGHEHHDG